MRSRPGPTIRDPILWIQGVPTDNIANEETVEMKQPMYVTGTKTYETVDGSPNTVRILQLIHLPN